jgi:ring-1,2-phenylacetyl-CoA epoxidase subunit PaaC
MNSAMNPNASNDHVAAPQEAVSWDQFSTEAQAAAKAYLYAIADDEMLIGHRDSEWTGLGPILEEDIAFSSMAQDELGHALVWFKLLESLGEPDPDRNAFLREASGWRNARFCELPRGDYAFSLVRQYLFDLAEVVRYDALKQSPWSPMAEAATKLRQEEKYHLLHGRAFVERLGKAGGESKQRLQTALDTLMPYAMGLWEAPEGEAVLVEAGILPSSQQLQSLWLEAVRSRFEAAELVVPEAKTPSDNLTLGGRRGEHGEDLDEILDALQSQFRTDPEAEW